MADKQVYFFGDGRAEGNAAMKNLLGGKGANLAEMVNLGIPVPPGFTITTEVCAKYDHKTNRLPEGLAAEVDQALARVEAAMGKKFGDPTNPLLLSVRSGARASMPGMMDTVLNLGLNDETLQGLIAKGGSPRFAFDSYRRFVSMYGDVVLGLKPESKEDQDPFEVILDRKKHARGVTLDNELTADDLKDLVAEYKAAIRERTGKAFPEDPRDQLWGAIGAVFRSWNNQRAIKYRELNKIPDDWGTAVNVQTMVFGNMGDDCATGVAFTRDPATGEKRFYGEFLVNAQGEDVVAGTRTPQRVTLADSRSWAESNGTPEADRCRLFPSLEEYAPVLFQQLLGIANRLETHYRDMQDMEFTIQNGKLWMLQTRNGKRTGFASFRIAVEMVGEGLITKEQALLRVEPDQLNQLLRPVFDLKEKAAAVEAGRLVARGLNAGPGAASGRVVFNAEDAEAWYGKTDERGSFDKIVLVRLETSPEDIRGMDVSEGILTARGGMTSHAALVARQMGKVCVAGCGALDIDYAAHQMKVGGHVIKEGDWISLDGSLGEVFVGAIKTRPSEVMQVLIEGSLKASDSLVYRQYEQLLGWADEVRRLRVRTNADQPDQAALARAFGAEGIGLCRTEHMFFEGDRIMAVRQMILADTLAERQVALGKLLPLQRSDFEGIFKAMDGLPVTIRTLDPPLHEFLPHADAEIEALAREMGRTPASVKAKVQALHEANPMLGHRGCRLGISFPEITEMQARAIFEAAVACQKQGIRVLPEIMIPLVGHVKEFELQREIVDRVAKEVCAAAGVQLSYMVGTMIEVPRAAVTADEIASQAQFFSFGTNDLTQTTLGMSRDDAGSFLGHYQALKIYPVSPFQSLDQRGVGALVKTGVELGRGARAELKVGICGEHGGDPASVEFCHRVGLNYVSCSPFRVPIARMAAAQAALRK